MLHVGHRLAVHFNRNALLIHVTIHVSCGNCMMYKTIQMLATSFIKHQNKEER